MVKWRELEGREPIINTPPLLSRHPKRIREKERFWLEERRKRVRRCDTTRPCGSTKSRKERVRSKVGKDRLCISLYDNKMRWRLSTPGSLKYILPVAQSTSVIPVSPYTRHRSVLCQAEWRWSWETDFPATPGLRAFSWRPGRLGTLHHSQCCDNEGENRVY